MLEVMVLGGEVEEPPATPGQVFFSSATEAPEEWVVPKGVKEICIVCVGQGGNGTPTTGGDGGALRWRNSVPVRSGEVLQIFTFGGGLIPSIAPQGVSSRVVRKATGETLLCAKGGGNTTYPSTPYDLNNGLGGGHGGLASAGYGGGGAGGYTNDGGHSRGQNGDSGLGGSGGGGGLNWSTPAYTGQGGGGVGLHGAGNNGAGGTLSQSGFGRGGYSGSVYTVPANQAPAPYAASIGGARFGGGAGRSLPSTPFSTAGDGAVRILWGDGRYFPSTNVRDV